MNFGERVRSHEKSSGEMLISVDFLKSVDLLFKCCCFENFSDSSIIWEEGGVV